MPEFQYGQKEIDYLKEREPRLGQAIEQIGYIHRQVIPDIFEALMNAIVGQQITTKAQETIWGRMKSHFGIVTPEDILEIEAERLQGFGISYRKVSYMKNISSQILDGSLSLEKLAEKSDEQICQELTNLNGIGMWTAEMILIFCLQRPNVMSYGDLAIHRGMRILYGLEKIDQKQFYQYYKMYSPCATVACLYLWEIARGFPLTLEEE